MQSLLYASATTLGIILVNKFMRQKPVNPMIWVALFLALLAFHLVSHSKAEATQFNQYQIMTHTAKEEISFLQSLGIGRQCAINAIQRRDYEQKKAHHQKQANMCLDKAREICWYLPNMTDQRKADYCWAAAGAAATPGGPQSKMVGVIIITMINYGLDCMNEWRELHEFLHSAQHHYELAEWYEHLLQNA